MKIKAIKTIEVDLEPKTGALSDVYEAFKDAGVDIAASWAFEFGPDQAEGIFYPRDADKAMSVLKTMGKSPRISKACWAEGNDAIGNYSDLLRKISGAGVNLHATDAICVDGKFATVFFSSDFNGLCAALDCDPNS